MRFQFPPLSDDPKRPWGPWVDLDPNDVSLTAIVRDAIDAVRDRLLFVPTVQLKWAYCDPDTNLWTAYADPGSCVRAVYGAVWQRWPYFEDVRLGLQGQLDRIDAIKDNLTAFGYGPADLSVLNADHEFLRSHLAEVKDAQKQIRGHRSGKRVLRTVITETLTETVNAPPNFNFRTQPIHGLPFLNGRLITESITQQDADGERHVRPSVRLVPYQPSDHVEQTRPIQRSFDMTGAVRRADVRWILDTGSEYPPAFPQARPYGWEWMLRGFLGLPRPSSPPPYSTPLDGEGADELDRSLWQAWRHGGTYTDMYGSEIFEGLPADRTDVLDWFDRLLSATLFADTEAPFKRIPFVFGPSNTGKSTLFNMIQQLIDPLYGHITNAALLKGHSFKDTSQLLASVMGRRFVTPSSEVPANAEWRSEVVKAYVGNDQLLAERKYENPVEFRPEGGMWVAGNHYLAHEDQDDSMSNRLIYLTFHQPTGQRLTPEEVTQLLAAESDDVLLHLARTHAAMKAEYAETRSPNYWSTVAFAYPEGFEPDLDVIRTETDPWAAFFEDCVTITADPEDRISNADLYAVFRHWCIRSEGMAAIQVMTRRQFTSRVLKNRKGTVPTRTAGDRLTAGLRWTPNGESLLMETQT